MCTCSKLARLSKGGIDALNGGNLVTATVLLSRAVRMTKRLDASVLQAKALNNLGLALQSRGRHAAARTCYRQALTRVVERVGVNNGLYRSIRANLARLKPAGESAQNSAGNAA